MAVLKQWTIVGVLVGLSSAAQKDTATYVCAAVHPTALKKLFMYNTHTGSLKKQLANALPGCFFNVIKGFFPVVIVYIVYNGNVLVR